jgi:hypothetical protein
MAHQQQQHPSPLSPHCLLLFPHEQYLKRANYKAASALARKQRRSKLNRRRRRRSGSPKQQQQGKRIMTFNKSNEDDHHHAAAAAAVATTNAAITTRMNHGCVDTANAVTVAPTTTPMKRVNALFATGGRRDHDEHEPDAEDRHDDYTTTIMSSNMTATTTTRNKKNQPWIIRPDPLGIRTAVSLIRNGHALAMPTECTYEVVMRMTIPTRQQDRPKGTDAQTLGDDTNHTRFQRQQQQQKNVITSHLPYLDAPVPHIYLCPDVAALDGLERRSSFWKPFIVQRSYGIGGATPMICRFNEAVLVLQVIASCLWPGPCAVYFPISAPMILDPDIRVSVVMIPPDTTCATTTPQHYVKFRSPRHPLAIRMCHELGYSSSSSSRSSTNTRRRRRKRSTTTAIAANTGGTTTTILVHEQQQSEDVDDDNVSETTSKSRTKSSGSYSSNVSSSRGGCSSSAAATLSSGRVDHHHHRYLLIGYPLSKRQCNSTAARDGGGAAVVTRSSDVPSSTLPTLDGEDETYEVLRVPTCREPSSDCWICVPRRTIFCSGNNNENMATTLIHALRKAQDPARPVQSAVLQKWKAEWSNEPFLATIS